MLYMKWSVWHAESVVWVLGSLGMLRTVEMKCVVVVSDLRQSYVYLKRH